MIPRQPPTQTPNLISEFSERLRGEEEREPSGQLLPRGGGFNGSHLPATCSKNEWEEFGEKVSQANFYHPAAFMGAAGCLVRRLTPPSPPSPQRVARYGLNPSLPAEYSMR